MLEIAKRLLIFEAKIRTTQQSNLPPVCLVIETRGRFSYAGPVAGAAFVINQAVVTESILATLNGSRGSVQG